MLKVSIVVPVYNMERYLRQCLDSLIAQTLNDIEIICVDDGSTDSSPEIIDEYVKKDSRVRVITKSNTGYGNSMNCGFDSAEGEYIGIVESDDYAEPDMFERLYASATENRLDVAKGGYFLYYSVPEEKNIKVTVTSDKGREVVFCPSADFRQPLEMADFFSMKPTIWSSIYRADFIRRNNIRFHETPGASYQDASFNFKVLVAAKRMALLPECFLHYRQDNENSSVNSEKKVYCVCDEYKEMEEFLNDFRGVNRKLEIIRNRMKYDSYMWNVERLAPEFREEFLERVSRELKGDLKNGLLHKAVFQAYDWKDLNLLIEDPQKFYDDKFVNRPPAIKLVMLKVLHVCQRKLRKIRGKMYLWKKDLKYRL